MSKRRAVSPVIATVILIAITLIAAVAIAGFVFGLFSGFTSTPQVTVHAVLYATDFSSGRGSFTATCHPDATTTPSGSYLLLRNSLTSNVSVIAVTLGGVTADADPAICKVPAGGQLYIQLKGSLNLPPTPGSQFSGIVSLSNGAQVPFSGTFR